MNVDNECRVFQEKSTDYFSKGRPVCLTCGQSLTVMKKPNRERHHRTKHTWKSELQGQLRKDKINTLRQSLGAQPGLQKVWPPKQVLKIDTAPDVRIRTISRFRRGDINACLSAENVHTRQCGGLEYQQTLNTECKHATIV